MKILHLGYSDTKGGAAIAMMRLHKALIELNIDSKVLVAEKLSNDPSVIGPQKSLEIIINECKKILVRQKKYFYKNNNSYSHSLNFFKSNIVNKINKINPDIVNLHWVNNELLSIGQIGEIKQPKVWTLVDMWPICGGEHYTESKRYEEGYNRNNRENTENGIDLNRFIWKKKNKHWDFSKDHIVCISEWLKKKTVKSILFKNSTINKINCHIDLKEWKPIEKNTARKILNLPLEKKIFLFVSTNGINDQRKGFKFVDKALQKLVKKFDNFELLLLGNGKNIEKKSYEFRIFDKVLNGNPTELKLIYSACDLVLAPSTLEAFGQIALEGSSCGVPCLAFKDTGIEDIIDHKKNGYLAKYLDQNDFDDGLYWILEKLKSNQDEIHENCLKYVNVNFGNNLIPKKYIELYKSITQQNMSN